MPAQASACRLRVLFLVRALTTGGAERQLLAAATGLARRGHEVRIAVFYRDDGPLESQASAAGIEVVDLRKTGRYDVMGFMGRLRSLLRERCIDAIYSYLPSANVVSSCATVGLAAPPAVIWGIRATDAGGESYDWLGHGAAAAERVLARRVDAIIVNSASGIRYHRGRGLPAERMELVRNGLDFDAFRFDADARSRWRQALGQPDDAALLLLAGRHDPVKGIDVFLHALAALQARAVVAGPWAEPCTSRLRGIAEGLGLADRVRWLDRQDDMAGLMSAADVVCSASTRSEGTPNVLIEAAASNAIVVGTDVGDTAEIVGRPELVSIPGDARDLARALRCAMAGAVARDRRGPPPPELQRYAMPVMVGETERVLLDAVQRARPGRGD